MKIKLSHYYVTEIQYFLAKDDSIKSDALISIKLIDGLT